MADDGSAGYPYFIQQFGRTTWNEAAMAIDGEGPSASGEGARRIGKKPTRERG